MLLLFASLALARPTVREFTVDADACGHWSARVHATGKEATVAIDGGEPMASWRPDGPRDLSGRLLPDTEHELTLRVGKKLVETRTLAMPAWDATFQPLSDDAFVAEGSAGALGFRVKTPCKGIDELWWVASGLPTAVEGALRPNVDGTLPVPAELPLGHHRVQVEVLTGGRPFAAGELGFEVGDPDVDDDGHLHRRAGGRDCDDANGAIHPDAREAPVPNGVDENCDGRIDEGTVAFDDDGDGHSENDGDCDDRDPRRYPGAIETADCRDEDCDGEIDEGAVPLGTADIYEPNGTEDTAYDLATSSQRRFTKRLWMVVDGTKDEEWFVFYSNDDMLDEWRIEVEAIDVAPGTSYELKLGRLGGSGARRAVKRAGDSLRYDGRGLLSDSGTYALRVRATTERACPLEIELRSY